jgi:hypothetical protein
MPFARDRSTLNLEQGPPQPHMETIMPSLTLFPKSTALVLIDLQKGITSFPVEPHPTAAVLENASLLANQFRDLNAPVFLVRAGREAARE